MTPLRLAPVCGAAIVALALVLFATCLPGCATVPPREAALRRIVWDYDTCAWMAAGRTWDLDTCCDDTSRALRAAGLAWRDVWDDEWHARERRTPTMGGGFCEVRERRTP